MVNPPLIFVVPSFSGGGAERVMITLANACLAEGFPVTFVVFSSRGPLGKALSPGVEVVDLRRPRSLFAIPALARMIKSLPGAVWISAMLHANVAVMCGRALAGSRARVILTEHCIASEELAIVGGLKRHVLLALMRWIYPRASAVVGVSQGVVEDLREKVLGPSTATNLKVIYNPIDVLRIQQLAESVREEDRPLHPRRFIVAVGRLDPFKDYGMLVRAFRIVAGTSDVDLLILGEGSCRAEIQALCREHGLQGRVFMPGFVSNPFGYIRQAELLVLTSTHEGFALVLAEALALGKTVVSTDCPSGPREITEDGKYGYLVTPKNETMMADSIRHALRVRFAPKAQVERARHFDVHGIVKQYIQLVAD